MSTKPCSYCSTEIATRAILCPTCRSYQSAWRNSVIFLAGITGFFTLIASALAFTLHQGTDIYKQLFRHELNVLELEAQQTPYLRTVMSNGSDGPVYASEFVVSWKRGSFSYRLDKIIPPNNIETINTIPVDPILDKYSWVQNKTGRPSDDVIGAAVIFGDRFDSRKTCILATIFDQNNADLTRMKGYIGQGAKKFTLGDAEVSIVYFASHSGERIQQAVPVVVGFLRNPTPDCQNKQLD